MTEPKLVTDLRSVFSDRPYSWKENIVEALSALARVCESEGLHYQAHEPTAERYMKHARFFERLAEAIR